MPDSSSPARRPVTPKGIPPRGLSYCKECAGPYYPAKDDQVFCGGTCRSRFHQRRSARGIELYDLAMDFRKKRLKGMFTKLCQILDDWIRDDRETEKKRKEKIAADRKLRKEADG